MAPHFTRIAFVTIALYITGCSISPNETSPADAQSVNDAADTSVVQSVPEPGSKDAEGAELRVVPSQEVAAGDTARMESIVVTGARIHPQALGAPVPEQYRHFIYPAPADRDRYDSFKENGFKPVTEAPVSTFSIDVDTASYANVRRYLNAGELPPRDAVRVEEMINYFAYDYPVAEDAAIPFSVTTEIGPSPWQEDRALLRIGIRGYERAAADLPAANLVFLVDTSGSMQSRDKLNLVKASLKMLARNLRAEDRIGIVAYAGAAGVVLEPTAGSETGKILVAIDRLQAGGSTNGGAGIVLAYRMAQDAFIDEGVNRVLLATDGDFNVGVTNQQALKEMVEEKKRGGISLTVLGFGRGNYNDALMQEIAQIGDGNAAYIDTLHEARKVLIDEMTSTFETIAKDVKIQIEFNPAVVAEYRLIGYESRHLDREDFNNDRVDAGDIGAGHRVTALYELTLIGSAARSIDPLRYQSDATTSREAKRSGELGFVKLRYKIPGSATSKLITVIVDGDEMAHDLAGTSEDYRFSTAVAAFGQLLKGGKYTGTFDYVDVVKLAQHARGADPDGYRAEFVNLVKSAAVLADTRISSR